MDGFDGAEVVGAGALVVKGHLAVALKVGGHVAGAGCINGELLVVDADAVAVGVWIGEEAGLEDRVGGGFDAGGHVGGVEGDLFDFGEVVASVFVQDEFADFAAGKLSLRPDVGEVEDVDVLLFPDFLGFFGGHGLDFDGPSGKVALFDGFIKILLGVVGRVIGRVFLGDKLDTLHGLHVKLTINPVIVLVDKLDGVAEVAIHEAIAIWNTSITHQNHDLMDRFGVLGEIVPKGSAVISMGEMSGWVTLLRVNEMWELGRVSQEEDRGIVGNDIPVAFCGPHLDGEASGVAGEIVRA